MMLEDKCDVMWCTGSTDMQHDKYCPRVMILQGACCADARIICRTGISGIKLSTSATRPGSAGTAGLPL